MCRYESSFEEWINESRYSTKLNLLNEQLDEPDSIRQQLTKFLYSLTAKDCSVLITVQKVLNISVAETCVNSRFHSKRLCFYRCKKDDSVYLFTLALIDLDRKQPEKVETTFNSDQVKIRQFLSSNH